MTPRLNRTLRPHLLHLEARIAPAVVLSDNLSKTSGGTEAVSGSRWLTSSFGTTTALNLTSVSLLLSNPITGTATLSVYSDSSLQPGTLVGTLTSPSSYSTSLASTTFTSSGIGLAANSTYWLVLKATTGEFDWSWTNDNTGSGVGFQHTFGESSDAGTTWYTSDVFPTQFSAIGDTAPTPGTIAFSSATYSGSEGSGSVTLNLTRTDGVAGAVSIVVSPSGGTATSGSDYTGLPIVVSFADGQSTATATIAIVNDTAVEGPETVTLSLGSATGGATLGTQSTATLTITDNDAAATTVRFTAIGTGSGTAASVAVYSTSGTLVRTIAPFGTFTGGVAVATADVTGDGTEDVIVAAGAGGGPHVKIYNGATGSLVREFFAYDKSFYGGVWLAAADVTGDGFADIVTGAGAGGGPHVRVFDGQTGSIVQEYFAYDKAFTGGVTVAAADVTGDGKADIVTGVGAGGGPHVKIFNGATGLLVREFFAYDKAFTGGVWVAAGDVTGDGLADIVTGAGAGGGPHVKIYNGSTGAVVREFFPYDTTFRGGVTVAVDDANGDGVADITTGPGVGGGPHVKQYNGSTGTLLREYFPFSSSLRGGIYVG